MKVKLEFKAADLWIGAFWKRTREITNVDVREVSLLPGAQFGIGGTVKRWRHRWDLWLCLLPCLPLHVTWWGRERSDVPRG